MFRSDFRKKVVCSKSVTKTLYHNKWMRFQISLLLWKLQMIRWFLIKFIKKRVQRKCCLVKSAKFLRTPILKNICERLLLHLHVLSFTMHENDIANEA